MVLPSTSIVLIFYTKTVSKFGRKTYEIHSNGWHEIICEDIILYAKLLLDRKITANLSKRDDLPTPEFPIRRTLKR
jgi:hypothetical protein